MAAVSQQNRKTKSEVMAMVVNMQHIDVTPEVLLMIDYAYHNTDDDYDDGLSFLNRLYSKLSAPFHLQWNLPNLKQFIRSSNDPSQTFLDVLNEILSDEMIIYYGV